MTFAPNADRPRPGRTSRANPSHSEGSSSIRAPLACMSRSGLLAGAHARGSRLLAGAGVAVQRAALDGLVDGRRQRRELAVGRRIVALGDGRLEAAEVRADRRRVAAVLEALALRAQDALLLGMNVGHVVRRG